MKILYIHTGMLEQFRANTIQVLQMCIAFSKLDHDVTLCITSGIKDEQDAVAKICEFINLKTIPFSIRLLKGNSKSPKINTLVAARQCINAHRDLKPDITFLRNPLLLPLIGKKCGSLIFESHNNLCLIGPAIIDSFWRKKVLSMAKQDNLKAFISISGALNKWWLEEGLPPEKALALHDAADTEFFAPGDKQAERTALNLPNDRKIVLYSGSLYKDRNIMNVLKLAKMRTDALFVIVGGPSAQANAMKDKASSMGISNTLFTGPVKYAMVPSYLSAADILLMLWSSDVPTINYCSPLKVFEYMSTERIIVGHGFPTIREVLSDNKTAYLADPSSLEDLRAKLEEALANTDNSMASKARALVVSEYNWTLRCRRILDKVNSAQ